MSRWFGAAVCVWVLMLGTMGAQQGTSEVRGRVADGSGAAMPGVTVLVRNQDTGLYRETVSGEGGAFIALASEEVAIRSIFPHEIDTFDPYEGEVRVWQS